MNIARDIHINIDCDGIYCSDVCDFFKYAEDIYGCWLNCNLFDEIYKYDKRNQEKTNNTMFSM